MSRKTGDTAQRPDRVIDHAKADIARAEADLKAGLHELNLALAIYDQTPEMGDPVTGEDLQELEALLRGTVRNLMFFVTVNRRALAARYPAATWADAPLAELARVLSGGGVDTVGYAEALRALRAAESEQGQAKSDG